MIDARKINNHMHVCNYQRILQQFIIISFLTQKHLNYFLKGATSEKSTELYVEGNERQPCVGDSSDLCKIQKELFNLDLDAADILVIHRVPGGENQGISTRQREVPQYRYLNQSHTKSVKGGAQEEIYNALPIKEALYNVIHMADFRSKRHFGPNSPDYTMNKFTMHR